MTMLPVLFGMPGIMKVWPGLPYETPFPVLFRMPRKYAHSGFSSLMHSLLPKDTLLRTYFKKIWPGLNHM